MLLTTLNKVPTAKTIILQIANAVYVDDVIIFSDSEDDHSLALVRR